MYSWIPVNFLGFKDRHDMNFSIEEGELCVIVGPSGAGKTTVLNMLGGLDTGTSAHI